MSDSVGRPGAPRARGPLSRAVLRLLPTDPTRPHATLPTPVAPRDPLADGDLQVALWTCHELSHHGLAGVDDAWEWHPAIVRFRTRLEQIVCDALERDVTLRASADAPRRVLPLTEERSAAALAWAVPRLDGAAKAALVTALPIVPVPTPAERRAWIEAATGLELTCATVVTTLALHRSHLGALIGHVAPVDVRDAVASDRPDLAEGLAFGAAARRHLDRRLADAVAGTRDLAVAG